MENTIDRETRGTGDRLMPEP